MNETETKKLEGALRAEQKLIEKELRSVANENPLVKGDYEVKVDDLGPTTEDAAQEAGELDRNQAIVDELEKKLKDITIARDKLSKGTYGKCEGCSVDIPSARLNAVPTASLCISCAKSQR